MLTGKRILLVISGGIAAFKALDLIRRLRAEGATVRCIMTQSACEFVTPLSVAALCAQPVYLDTFSLKDESEMGHIRLSREADLVVVAPATANLIAKMVTGIADDLATTTLIAPAMNVRMWHNVATQRNIDTLRGEGVRIVGPVSSKLADGKSGNGRLVEPADLVPVIAEVLTQISPSDPLPLAGRRALVTSGQTHEPLDPVRYIVNRPSGRLGHAIAAALVRLGADTLLVSGPTALAGPPEISMRFVTTARQMLAETEAATENAEAKRLRKGCDWILANSVAQGATCSATDNPVTIIGDGPHDAWPVMSKDQIADRLAGRIADHLRVSS